MLAAFFRAIGQLTDPRILRVLGYCVLLSTACFAAVWAGVAWLLTTPLFDIGWLDTSVAMLGAAATLVLTWLMFPLLASAFVGLFLEQIAGAVEARHYRDLPPARGLGFWVGLGASLRFLGLVVVVNLLLLLLLLFPIAYPVGYVVANGWLLAREYFELVAFRRLTPQQARAMRGRHGLELLAMGVGTAFLVTLPIVNFVAPVVATATMVHRFEVWRRRDLVDGSGYGAGGG